MSSFSIATGALTTNLAALQVVGHNIANVNTPGYSRQTVQQAQVPGQLFGNGYFGKGVEIAAVERAYNGFLTREANTATSVAASTGIQFNRLQTLEQLFPMGEAGFGRQLNNFLNSWADVVASPTNQTARGVVLTTADEIAARLRQTAGQLDELRVTTRTQIEGGIDTVNRLTQNIADLNQRVIEAYGSGRAPNDLLDQRDQLVAELNKFVQTTTLEADDRSLTVFIGSSYPAVVGSQATPLINPPPTNESGELSLAIGTSGGLINTDLLGGGELQGLLNFFNEDIGDVRNQLGRMALSMVELTNRQHRAGLDLNGNPGVNFFRDVDLSNTIVKSNQAGAGTSLTVVPDDLNAPTRFKASDYTVTYESGAGNEISIRRTSDGLYFNGVDANGEYLWQAQKPAVPLSMQADTDGDYIDFDGLRFRQDQSQGTFGQGDTVLLRPFSNVAEQVQVALTSPSQLAVASPILVEAGVGNADTLQVESLYRLSSPTQPTTQSAVGITFAANGRIAVNVAPGTLDAIESPAGFPLVPDPVDGDYAFVSGREIVVRVQGEAPFRLVLRGQPSPGDTFTVREPQRDGAGRLIESMAQNTGNGQALLSLRDADALDGYTLSDGYIPVFSSVASSIQTAKSAAEFSARVADQAESARANQAGVNLDEEAARLLQYQQAYQAAAKYLQTIQGSFDILIQAFR